MIMASVMKELILKNSHFPCIIGIFLNKILLGISFFLIFLNSLTIL